MKPSEFIEKHWRVQGVGGAQKAVTLTEHQKRIIDAAVELGVPMYVPRFGRGGTKHMVNPVITEYLNSQQNT